MHKHPMWTVVMAAALLVILNALALPKMLDAAYAMPEGEIVAQAAANDGDRLPLPEIPKGFSGYELNYSREMTEAEQALWREAGERILDMEMDVPYAINWPKITYSMAAAARYREAQGNRSNLRVPLMRTEGADEKGVTEIGLDLGVVTIFLPDTELTLDQAIGLLHMLPWSASGLEQQSTGWICKEYNHMFSDFWEWVGLWNRGAYRVSRGLCPDERERYEGIINRYLYEGLRAQSPLLTAKPDGDAMWYDEQMKLLHFPEQHQLTDDEMLMLYELNRTLQAQAVIAKSGTLIAEAEAVELAGAYLKAVLGMDPASYRVITALQNDGAFSTSGPVWLVTYASEEMPEDAGYETTQGDAQVAVSAKDGLLMSAYNNGRPVPLQGVPTKQMKSGWRDAAREMVERALADGNEVKGVDSGGRTQNTTEWIVRLKGGEDYQVGIGTDGRVRSVRYWPEGCKDLG